jgi:hypothetical protein
MLSDAAAALLRKCRFRADAQYRICSIPLQGIFWGDEMPDLPDFYKLSRDEQNTVWRLFGIRKKVWDGKELSDDESSLWESARAKAPEWALFHRLVLSDEERVARREMEQQAWEENREFFARADRIVVVDQENGMTQFTATFPVAKSSVSFVAEERSEIEQSQRWWKKWWRRLKRSSQSGG